MLAAVLLSNVFVFGQGKKLDSMHFNKPDFGVPRLGFSAPGQGLEFGQTAPGYIRPPMIMKASPKTVTPLWAQGTGINSVRIMSPDRMPCVVTDLSKMEPMPVGRQRNLDNIPNAYERKRVAMSMVVTKW